MTDPPLTLPDVNVLVALTNPSHVFHHESHSWLSGVTRFATTPLTESGLLRLLLNPQVAGQVVSPQHALVVLTELRADRRAEFLVDDSTLSASVVETTGITGHQQITDWHLLNLAARHDGVLVTFDRRLARAVMPGDRPRILTLR